MRLDKWLLTEAFSSRAKAQDAIQEGRVRVNGKVVLKNSYEVSEQDVIEVAAKEHEFVSRAGKKMFDVLDAFGITGIVCCHEGSQLGMFPIHIVV